MEKVQVQLEPAEYEALSRLAERNIRPVPSEIRYHVRQALQDAGLLELPVDRRPVAEAGR